MSEAYWPSSVPSRVLDSVTAARRDDRAAFQPEIGPAIMRPRSTGRTLQIPVTFQRWTAAQFEAFQVWYDQHQARRFLMRDPTTGVPAKFQLAAGEEDAYRLAGRQVSLNLLRLPGTLWWADYVLPCTHVPPAMIADFVLAAFAVDAGSLQHIAREALVTEIGDPSAEAGGALLDADDEIRLILGAWVPARGTWVIRYADAAATAFEGTAAETLVAGDGNLVVTFDGAETRSFSGGVKSADLGPWSPAGAVAVLSGVGMLAEVLLFPEVLSDKVCLRASLDQVGGA